MNCKILLLAALLGCGRPRECTAGDFIYRDQQCPAPAPGSQQACSEVGDGQCHLRCAASSDCPPSHPFCRNLGLFNGGDYSCNAKVYVCRETDRNACAP